MSTKKILELDIIEILQRVAEVARVERNNQIAEVLGVSPSAVTNWKRQPGREIPFPKLFSFARKYEVSFEWLLTGKVQAPVIRVEITNVGRIIGRLEWST